MNKISTWSPLCTFFACGHDHATTSPNSYRWALQKELHGALHHTVTPPISQQLSKTHTQTHTHIQPPHSMLGLITQWCLRSGRTVHNRLIFFCCCCGGGFLTENSAVPLVCVRVFLFLCKHVVYACAQKRFLKARAEPQFTYLTYIFIATGNTCQMLPCSEVTCGFETGHSFPISAWEPASREKGREREREWGGLLNEVIIVSSRTHHIFAPTTAAPASTSSAGPPRRISCQHGNQTASYLPRCSFP